MAAIVAIQRGRAPANVEAFPHYVAPSAVEADFYALNTEIELFVDGIAGHWPPPPHRVWTLIGPHGSAAVLTVVNGHAAFTPDLPGVYTVTLEEPCRAVLVSFTLCAGSTGGGQDMWRYSTLAQMRATPPPLGYAAAFLDTENGNRLTTIDHAGVATVMPQQGSPGANGAAAFSTVAAPGFTMPAIGGTAAVVSATPLPWAAGMPIYVQGAGHLVVSTVADSTHATLRNDGAVDNVAPGTAVAVGAVICPSGATGTAGAAGVAGEAGPQGIAADRPDADFGPVALTAGAALATVYTHTLPAGVDGESLVVGYRVVCIDSATNTAGVCDFRVPLYHNGTTWLVEGTIYPAIDFPAGSGFTASCALNAGAVVLQAQSATHAAICTGQVFVQTPTHAKHVAPVVTISSPAAGFSVTRGGTITVAGSAALTNGATLSKVTVHEGTRLWGYGTVVNATTGTFTFARVVQQSDVASPAEIRIVVEDSVQKEGTGTVTGSIFAEPSAPTITFVSHSTGFAAVTGTALNASGTISTNGSELTSTPHLYLVISGVETDLGAITIVGGSWTGPAYTWTEANVGAVGLRIRATNGLGTTEMTVTGTVSLADTTAPTITTFTTTASATPLTADLTIVATDNVAVTHYRVSEDGTTPTLQSSGWVTTAPATFLFMSGGAKTLYLWAHDAAGNISARASATVTISSNILFEDTFDRANGAIGNNWVDATMAAQIVSNAMVATTATGGFQVLHHAGGGSLPFERTVEWTVSHAWRGSSWRGLLIFGDPANWGQGLHVFWTGGGTVAPALGAPTGPNVGTAFTVTGGYPASWDVNQEHIIQARVRGTTSSFTVTLFVDGQEYGTATITGTYSGLRVGYDGDPANGGWNTASYPFAQIRVLA